ncbi:MAG: DsbA family protein [Anaerolineae bacterium]
MPFAANPARPGYTHSGDVTLGTSEAPLLLLEFIDFGSAENYQYFLETWPGLKEKYVDTGKVRVIIKYFPGTDSASQAAEAAECAGVQQAYWPMHDLLFRRQQEWSQAQDLPMLLKEYAAELHLDAEAFSACLTEGQVRTKVEQDVMIARWNQLPPAPQFVLLYGGQAYLVLPEELLEALESLTQ